MNSADNIESFRKAIESRNMGSQSLGPELEIFGLAGRETYFGKIEASLYRNAAAATDLNVEAGIS